MLLVPIAMMLVGGAQLLSLNPKVGQLFKLGGQYHQSHTNHDDNERLRGPSLWLEIAIAHSGESDHNKVDALKDVYVAAAGALGMLKPQFIDAISWFPMVYWMPGLIDNLDDLIKAGINLAHSVVVTNKESTNSAEEDYLADCNTIVAVQTMFKMFPSVGIITELSQSSNMRFMQFRAHDVLYGGLSQTNFNATKYNHYNRNSSQRKLQSRYYKKNIGKEYNSHAYKFRLPFAAGNVFSASMLDTLLYQAFVKDYMITMVRLLLGIDQAPGSGFLSSMRITREDLWIRTYGRLYQRLCSTTCEIPIGIYRTEPLEAQKAHNEPMTLTMFASQQASYEHATEELERQEITNLVKNRLQDLGMPVSDYDDASGHRNNTFSYVIINPNCDIQLREGDIIYLIRPSPIHSRKLFMHRANSVRHDIGKSSASGSASAGAAAPTTIHTNTGTHTKDINNNNNRMGASGQTNNGNSNPNPIDTTATQTTTATTNNLGGAKQSTRQVVARGQQQQQQQHNCGVIMKACASDGDLKLAKQGDDTNNNLGQIVSSNSSQSNRTDSVQIYIKVEDNSSLINEDQASAKTTTTIKSACANHDIDTEPTKQTDLIDMELVLDNQANESPSDGTIIRRSSCSK